ncbi:MAG: metalloregulator ArsR/SmtB family transcription factor [Acidimicrobiia bacterium]|nr:metalloregulator ArsR/SmtB family transcription factor [Acidimicrobiia bacterium]NNC74323.1 helix-turn-helix transcriptional regulator [Acidimicrobiia bacterium]
MNEIPVCCIPGSTPTLSTDDATELAGVMKALADPARLRILNLMTAAGEVCACDLEAPLGLSQPTVSHHLKVLREAGIIEREQRGRWAYFSARAETMASISAALSPVS